MSRKIIAYFAKRHVLTNLLFLAALGGGVFAWQQTSKEELPSVTFDFVRITVRYPGAPAADVEYFIAKPLEEKLRGLDGVYRLRSTCNVGQASIFVELERDLSNIDEVVTEIRGTVLDVDYPDGVLDDPSVRVFKTDKKAILDVALIHTGTDLFDVKTRRELQKYAFALENRLISIPEVHSVNKRGYLQEEIQIRTYPDRLRRFETPLNAIMRQIRTNHIRQPAGTIEAKGEPKVTLLSELNTVERLKSLIIQGGFEGRMIRLEEVAEIEKGFEKNKAIFKVNGHEAVMYSVVKSPSFGILDALDASVKIVEEFRRNNLKGTPIEIVLLDDESIDVRNRLHLIGVNGGIGFFFILAILFVFLNWRAAFWVAMGIPFTLGVTMIAASWLGYTINGTTLSAVIIVMGIVVDDAIVVAENIARLMNRGMARAKAVVEGAAYMVMPIFASIATTCVAFVPLFFFTGHFGKFVSFIPPIIFLMLAASLFEAFVILPGHINLGSSGKSSANGPEANGHWFENVEARYGRWLERLLPRRGFVLAGLAGLLVATWITADRKMKFVMFPREETRDIVLTGATPPGSTRYETARAVLDVENLLKPYLNKEMVGFTTSIARSRRGGAVEENKFRILIEIVPKEKRKKSADKIIKEIQEKLDKLTGFRHLKFRKGRWGSDSGSPIELIVQQNDDQIRQTVVKELARRMEERPALANIEIDEGLFVDEYRIEINRDKIKRLSINPADVASTLRAALEGVVLYEFSNGDEDVRVRLTTVDSAKDDIKKVLSIPVENDRNYLVPLGDIVHVEKVVSPNSISRRDMKRTTLIDADLKPGAKMTPVEAAEDLEANVFPDILSRWPTTTLSFGGEVQDTRESKRDFANAVWLALFLIYIILAVLFDSSLKPLIIMLAIPFGCVGVALAFLLHGKLLFGFYAAVGVLGLAGVVINDSIIMLVKLEGEVDPSTPKDALNRRIANTAQTRLRAVLLTTLTTVAGVLPTAYGFAGYDSMLAEMMLALAWGLVFGTVITLVMIPCLYRVAADLQLAFRRKEPA